MGSLTVLTGQLDELETLHAEATAIRARLVVEAIERLRRNLEAGVRPLRDDCEVVQQFIAKRQQQDRYGK